MFKRPIFQKILSRCQEPRKFIQVLAGPRQVGKTTLAHQLEQELNFPVPYASADNADIGGSFWIEQEWKRGRSHTKNNSNGKGSLLISAGQKTPNFF